MVELNYAMIGSQLRVGGYLPCDKTVNFSSHAKNRNIHVMKMKIAIHAITVKQWWCHTVNFRFSHIMLLGSYASSKYSALPRKFLSTGSIKLYTASRAYLFQ